MVAIGIKQTQLSIIKRIWGVKVIKRKDVLYSKHNIWTNYASSESSLHISNIELLYASLQELKITADLIEAEFPDYTIDTAPRWIISKLKTILRKLPVSELAIENDHGSEFIEIMEDIVGKLFKNSTYTKEIILKKLGSFWVLNGRFFGPTTLKRVDKLPSTDTLDWMQSVEYECDDYFIITTNTCVMLMDGKTLCTIDTLKTLFKPANPLHAQPHPLNERYLKYAPSLFYIRYKFH